MCEVIRESYHNFFEFASIRVEKGISEEILDKIADWKGGIGHGQWKSRFRLKQCD